MYRLHQGMLFLSSAGPSGSDASGVSGMDHNNKLGLSFGESTRPGLSFPLGTGLVVLIILFVSALFSFCYHWLSLKKTRSPPPPSQASPADHGDLLTVAAAALQQQAAAHQPLPSTDDAGKTPPIAKLSTVACPPVVFMAGEYMPRFIAVPCPFAPAASPFFSQAQGLDDYHLRRTPSDALKLDIRL